MGADLRGPAPGSFEERLLRVRLWTLPLLAFGPGFVWGRLALHGIVPELPYGAFWAFVFLWWVLEAAPRPYSLRSTFGGLPRRSDLGWALLLVAAMLCLRGAWWFGQSSWQQLLAGTVPNVFTVRINQPSLCVATAVVTIVVAPVLEELVWRGALFRKWRARFGPLTGLLLSSVLFGVGHDERIASTIMGMTMVLLYTRSGSLWAPLLFHVVNNAMGVALGAWGTLQIGLASAWSLAVFLLVVLAGLAAWFRFVLQSWRTLGAVLPPASLLPQSSVLPTDPLLPTAPQQAAPTALPAASPP